MVLEKVNIKKKYWNAECCNCVTAVNFPEKKPKTLQFCKSDLN